MYNPQQLSGRTKIQTAINVKVIHSKSMNPQKSGFHK